jgi:hypothetical protein
MSNAPRCPTCKRVVSLRADRCPMCGEDLESYRLAQAKLLIVGVCAFVVVTIFLIPAFLINWLFGRFERFITDTFFDWPSYLISLICWGGVLGALFYFGKTEPET